MRPFKDHSTDLGSRRGLAGAALLLPLMVALTCGGLLAVPDRAAAGPGSERTTFGDTFANNRIDGWSRLDEGTRSGPSNWRASLRRLRDTSGVYGGSTSRAAIAKPGTILHAGNPTWRDYEFSVSLYSRDDDAIGAVFRFQDKNNYYRFSMDHQRRYRRLVTKVDGRYSLLAESSSGYAPGRWHRLRIVDGRRRGSRSS